MNELIKSFKMSRPTQLMFQDVLHELSESYRETFIEAMAAYSSELQLHLTGRLLEEFRKDLSKSLGTMLLVEPLPSPSGGSNGVK